jgi:hypothetical protein
MSCKSDVKSDYKLSDDQFEQLLFDVELAREASRTIEYQLQDSVFEIYLDAIGLRYDMGTQEIESEIKYRLAETDDFESIYDSLRVRLDSMMVEKPLNAPQKKIKR